MSWARGPSSDTRFKKNIQNNGEKTTCKNDKSEDLEGSGMITLKQILKLVVNVGD
jgi:hypothetical protein